MRRGLQASAELVHLRAAVVDVELAGDLGAGAGQHPGERVTDRGPAGVAEVQRAGRVGRDELEVDRAALQAVARPVARRRRRRWPGDLALGVGGDPDVDEAGAGDLDRGDRVVGAQPGGEQLGELARSSPAALAELHRDVGGVVPVLGVLGTLDLQLARQPALDGDGAVVGERGQGLQDLLSELFRSHRLSLMAPAPNP